MSLRNKIEIFLNTIFNFLYQKIKYSKKYLFYANLEDIEIHKKNFYLKKIKKRSEKKISKIFFKIDINNLCLDNAMTLESDINPLVKTTKEIIKNSKIDLTETALFKHFENFQPNNYQELFSLKKCKTLSGLSQFVSFYPWFHKYPQRFLIPGFFGPKDISFPLLRFVRLKNLINLISKYNYIPTEEDSITGYKLVDGKKYKFIITAGAHRSSVLKGLNKIKVIDINYDSFRLKNKKKIINILDINNWPGVASGFLPRKEAESFFYNFFKKS